MRPKALHEARRLAVLVAVLALVLLGGLVREGAKAYVLTSTTVDVSSDGYAKVTSSIAFNSTEGALVIQTLALPDAYSIVATDAGNSAVPFSLNGSALVLNVLVKSSPITLTYSTPLLTAKSGAIWTLNMTVQASAEVVLPVNASLVNINRFPSKTSSIGNRIHMTLGNGTWSMEYFVSPAGTTTGQGGGGLSWQVLLIGAAAAVVAVAVAVALFLRRRRGPVILRPDDEKILAFVKSRGGRVYASDIVNSLGMPKSSVWKALRRLEANGIIKTRKDGNRVIVEA